MASEIGLIKSFGVYTFEALDDKQLLSYLVDNNRIQDLKPEDEDTIIGFDAPILEHPDQLCFKVGSNGFLIKIVERKHGYPKGKVKLLTRKLFEPKLRDARASLEEGEELSGNMKKKLEKEAREEAKNQMRKDGLTDPQEKDISILIMVKEKLAFISVDENYKNYDNISKMLQRSGVEGLRRFSQNQNSIRNSLTEVLKHQGLVNKIDVGKDRDGQNQKVSLGGSVRLKQQNAGENEAPELVHARHFELNSLREEINGHITSDFQKMSESLEFYITTSSNKTYHATLNTESFFSGVGFIKQPGTIEEEGDEYIIDTAVRATGMMVSFKNLLESLEGLSA